MTSHNPTKPIFTRRTPAERAAMQAAEEAEHTARLEATREARERGRDEAIRREVEAMLRR
jgi:hypothetical protein